MREHDVSAFIIKVIFIKSIPSCLRGHSPKCCLCLGDHLCGKSYLKVVFMCQTAYVVKKCNSKI